MHETIEKTNAAPGTPSPVDGHIRDLIADVQNPASQLHWEELEPENAKSYPRYRLRDADGNITTLSCDIDEDTHSQYTIRVIDEESRPLMSSTEWRTAGHPSELGILYALLRDRCHAAKPEMKECGGGYASPEQTDCFISALLRDAKMERPLLSWKREHHDDKVGYYSAGLSKRGSIWLQQDHADENSDSYTLQYVRDGEMLLCYTETASLTENPDCQLRELYHRIAIKDPEDMEVLVSAPEIHRFVAETESREMVERICKNIRKNPCWSATCSDRQPSTA